MKHGERNGAGGSTPAKLESWQQKHYFSLGLHFYRHLWAATAVSCRRGTRGMARRAVQGREFKRDFCSLIMRLSGMIGCPFYWAGMCYHYYYIWRLRYAPAIPPSHKYDHNELKHHAIGTNANRVRRTKTFPVSRQNSDRCLQIETDMCTRTQGKGERTASSSISDSTTGSEPVPWGRKRKYAPSAVMAHEYLISWPSV